VPTLVLSVRSFEQYGPKTLLAIFCGPKGALKLSNS
tara:strand:- start:9168 stop:9275 length:108 start_codon:yes stop_codon:yes gene_type:complete